VQPIRSSPPGDAEKRARVLIIDDEPGNIMLLEATLQRLGLAEIRAVTDSRLALDALREFGPDLILLDLNMPYLSGLDLLQMFGTIIPRDEYLPILVLTGETDPASKLRALSSGATDMVQKPFVSAEVMMRIRTLLRARFLHLEVQNQKEVLEQRVAERTEELSKALAELKASEAQMTRQVRLLAFSEMAGGVVHDFNNALMAVIGYSELLLGDAAMLDDRATVVECLQTMNIAGRDAAHVVSRLRDFYRPRDLGDVIALLDLNELLEQAVAITQPKWSNHALASSRTIEVQLDLEKLPLLNVNEAELRELATNLIFNAVDAMPRGGTIIVRSRRHEMGALLEFCDSGIGMPEEVRSRCLEPFFSTTGDKGTGLGLSMVFGIVKRHSGRLEVASTVGQGTTFSIYIPFVDVEAERQAAECPPPERPLRILVVDDEPVTRDVVTRYLQMDGHLVTAVSSALAALTELENNVFELLLTDHGMPGMSGLELVKCARRLCPGMPILMLTGFGQEGLHSGDKPPGVDVVINKPVPPLKLRRAVAEAILAPQNVVPFQLVREAATPPEPLVQRG
jgi:signal transduction histidine kinase